MRLLLFLGDAYFIKGRVGVGAYHRNVIFGLKTEYDIIVPDSHGAVLPANARPSRLSKIQKRKISFLKWILPVSFFFKGYDCIITDSFSFIKSKKTDIRLFMIVHDCMTSTEPKNYTVFQRLYARLSSRTYKYADKVIAVSESTRQTLHDVFHLPYSKLAVVPNITDVRFEKTDGQHFLFIGDMRKTKNLHSLLDGFALFKRQFGTDEKLVIVGRKKYEYDSLCIQAKDLCIDDVVCFAGYVSDEDKVAYLKNAKALVLLSDNEGFGIPLIEAAANGVPVICSDIPVFHEILNEDVALFVDSKDTLAIALAFCDIQKKSCPKETQRRLREKYSQDFFAKKINALIEEQYGDTE